GPDSLTASHARARHSSRSPAEHLSLPHTKPGSPMPPRDRSPNASSPPLQPTASVGSLAEGRCDPDRLLLGHLGFEPVGDAALFPEQRVTGEAKRLRLEVAIRVE